MKRRALLLFTKPALPGRVKTRLIAGGLSAETAASLHGAFLSDLVERFGGGPATLRVCWALEPSEAVPAWPANGTRQCDGDLGERLFDAFRRCRDAPAGFRFAAAIGTDCPDLPAEPVDAAFAALERDADVVLVPAEDGGYVLVALRLDALAPRLFEAIPWSGSEVLATTVARAVELRLRVRILEPERDVDTVADLEALAERLSRADPGACRATRSALVAAGLVVREGNRCAS